ARGRRADGERLHPGGQDRPVAEGGEEVSRRDTMSHPYDASTKYLVQVRPADWLALVGRSTRARVELLDTDLATVTAAADRILRVHDSPPWVFHLELQANRDADLV